MEIKARTIPEAHRRLVYRVWNQGKELTDERGDLIRELTNVHVEMQTADLSHVPGFERMDNDFAQGLIDKITALNKGSDFVYAYGERIHFLDQLNKTVTRLINNPETRRAYIPIYDKIDNCGAEDIPCCVGIQFLIRDNKLKLTVTFRSNDIFIAFPSDAYGFRALQKRVADLLKIEVGGYYHDINSCHIRMTDEDVVIKFLS